MSQLLGATFQPKPAVVGDLGAYGTEVAALVESQRTLIQRLLQTGAEDKSTRDLLTLGALTSKTVVRSAHEQIGPAQKIFDSLVQLKVAVSQYAMHLSPEVRQKIFDDLEAVLNIEDWYEEDMLPLYRSFRDFLRWTVYSRRFNWASIGVSDEGNVLVAWKTDKALLTASFNGTGRVWWAAKAFSPAGAIDAAGDSPLAFFEKESRLYLDEA